ncbi:peptidylprolyl isomerase, partial [Candidatus Peregrinibacteria bacterium CG_4_10_14_0_2_um_filter_43_11]
EGLDVVDTIVNVDRDAHDKPLENVVMKKVELDKYRK